MRASRLTYILVLSASLASGASSQIPSGYYDTVVQSSAQQLRETVHAVIDDHKRFPYTSTLPDTWNVIASADEDPGNTANVLTIYRNASYPKETRGNDFYNREHSWPKSYGFPNDRASNYPYTDCHHLFAADSGYNSSRSNKPYGVAPATSNERPSNLTNGNGGGSGTYPGNSNWTLGRFSTGRWQVWHHRRGDIARAMFYMDVRYEGGTHTDGSNEPDLRLTDDENLIEQSNTGNNEDIAHMGMLSVLLEWHEEDPVDADERRRNDRVFQSQRNRNPFIDHPEWVAIVYGSPVVAASVWINEIHYDDVGADTNEFIEVAGPAGQNLTGWKLVLYDGAKRRTYLTLNLTGKIPNQQNGVGTVAIDASGIQNGARDGIALVNNTGAVVAFISYEGTVAARDGPADGSTSTDIGVEESRATPNGHSLQMRGNGRNAKDFTWAPAAPATRGKPNNNQTF